MFYSRLVIFLMSAKYVLVQAKNMTLSDSNANCTASSPGCITFLSGLVPVDGCDWIHSGAAGELQINITFDMRYTLLACDIIQCDGDNYTAITKMQLKFDDGSIQQVEFLTADKDNINNTVNKRLDLTPVMSNFVQITVLSDDNNDTTSYNVTYGLNQILFYTSGITTNTSEQPPVTESPKSVNSIAIGLWFGLGVFIITFTTLTVIFVLHCRTLILRSQDPNFNYTKEDLTNTQGVPIEISSNNDNVSEKSDIIFDSNQNPTGTKSKLSESDKVSEISDITFEPILSPTGTKSKLSESDKDIFKASTQPQTSAYDDNTVVIVHAPQENNSDFETSRSKETLHDSLFSDSMARYSNTSHTIANNEKKDSLSDSTPKSINLSNDDTMKNDLSTKSTKSKDDKIPTESPTQANNTVNNNIDNTQYSNFDTLTDDHNILTYL